MATDQTQKIVKGELITYFARACMIAATCVGLPAAGFMMQRIIGQADNMQLALQQQTIELKLLTQGVRQTFDGHTAQLSDHELRLRRMERGNVN